MNVKTLMARTVRIEFPFVNAEGVEETITADIFENALTPAVLTQFKTLADTQDTAVISMICAKIVKSWSLDWDGEEWPPTEENLSLCPVAFLIALMEAAAGVVMGNAPKPKPLPSGSAVSAT